PEGAAGAGPLPVRSVLSHRSCTHGSSVTQNSGGRVPVGSGSPGVHRWRIRDPERRGGMDSVRRMTSRGTEIDRRRLLGLMGAGLVTGAVAPWLASCSSGDGGGTAA